MVHARTIRVLHIEDDESLAALVDAALAGADVDARFEVVHAFDAASGLAWLGTERFDVVALDHRLPDASGLDVLRQTRDCGVPVVVLTAVDEVRVAVESMKEGAADYVVKDGQHAFVELLPRVLLGAVEKQTLRRERDALVDLLASTDGRRDHDALARLVSSDALTGVANRRYLDAVLARELQTAVACGTPVALILCDLDGFKALNDERGHMAGDEALRRVAGVLQRGVRPNDLVARYGGDEFVVVMPGCDESVAAERSGWLCRQVAALGLNDGRVTLSLGVAAVIPVEADSDVVSALVEAADLALYNAKRAGKNRVERASSARSRAPRRSFSSLAAQVAVAASAPEC